MKLNKSFFKKINLITIVAVYFLILVGGIVRSVGAGMGCPDWPKCFGQVAPPTSAEQLPDNYQEIFLEKRLKKNERFASVLSGLGFEKLSNRITSDPSIKIEEEFSVVKAWTEYINRLIGVLIGFFIILNTIWSLTYWKEKRSVSVMAILAFILVLFQGWIGSLVVSTNLLPGFVTFHMALALLLVCMLIWIQYKIVNHQNHSFNYRGIALVLFLLMIPQTLLGTQVRESIDLLVAEGISRNNWIENLDLNFYIHRTASLLIAGLLGFALYKAKQNNISFKSGVGLVLAASSVVVLIEIIGGAIMAYFSVPAFIQPLHLLFASVLIGLFYYLFLLTRSKSANG